MFFFRGILFCFHSAFAFVLFLLLCFSRSSSSHLFTVTHFHNLLLAMATPSVLFYLIPLNDTAQNVAEDPSNRVFWAQDTEGQNILAVGHVDSLCPDQGTIVTLGRQGDITIANTMISRHHCSFVVHQESRLVMVIDKSLSQTTTLVGKTSKDEVLSFEPGRPRRIALNSDATTCIGLGGAHKNLVQFGIEWAPNAAAELKRRIEALRQQNPRYPPTPDIALSTTTTRPSNIRFWKIEPALGRGSFGEVYRAVNFDNGQIMAVKTVKKPAASAENDAWKYLKREIHALGTLQHEHIVRFLGFQDWDKEEALIFMGLMDGSLASLVCNSPGSSCESIAHTALSHTLQAIDFLAANKFVHRDVKPDNILYSRIDGGELYFRLGDLGFCNITDIAVSNVGTPLYQAPEIGTNKTQSMADVWSLYVTMVWTMDVGGFRGISKTPGIGREEIHDAVARIATQNTPVSVLKAMARRDPSQRASAAQMLVKCYGGVGLTTERHHILPIADDAPYVIPDGSEATPASTSWKPTADAAAVMKTRHGADDMLSLRENQQPANDYCPGPSGHVGKLAVEHPDQAQPELYQPDEMSVSF